MKRRNQMVAFCLSVAMVSGMVFGGNMSMKVSAAQETETETALQEQAAATKTITDAYGEEVEIPAEVTVTLEVLKGISIDNPMLEDGEACYTIASHENVETAVYTAVKAMTDILMRELGMSLEDAGMLLSAMGNLQFCQVVDPKRTVRMEMKKTVLKKLF